MGSDQSVNKTALIDHMAEWFDDTARKTRAIGGEDPNTEARIEGMVFALEELNRYLTQGGS